MGYISHSILEVDGARERAVEFHSFSKTFSMAGWRVGFVAGNRNIVDALRTLKSNVDSGVFGAVLLAAAELRTDAVAARNQDRCVVRGQIRLNSPPKLPRSEATPAVLVEATSCLIRRRASSWRSMSTPASR